MCKQKKSVGCLSHGKESVALDLCDVAQVQKFITAHFSIERQRG